MKVKKEEVERQLTLDDFELPEGIEELSLEALREETLELLWQQWQQLEDSRVSIQDAIQEVNLTDDLDTVLAARTKYLEHVEE